MSNTSWCI